MAANALRDEFLGAHLAWDFDLREIGLYYYVMASSETLGDALRRMERYSTMGNEGIALKYLEGKDIAIVFDYVGVARHSDRHQIEGWATALIRACRQLTNRRLLPTRVKFIHRRSEDCSELTRLLGRSLAGEPAARRCDRGWRMRSSRCCRMGRRARTRLRASSA